VTLCYDILPLGMASESPGGLVIRETAEARKVQGEYTGNTPPGTVIPPPL
jgi:hypothetical protein